MLKSFDDYYNIISEGYDELYGEEQLRKLRFMENCIKKYAELNEFIRHDYKLLDIGCGTGISTQFFNVKEKYGIDPSSTLIKLAVDKYPKCRFFVLSAEDMIPLKKEYDIIISLTAIQNFKNINKGLLNIKNAGKRFILSFLKRSAKKGIIEKLIEKNFQIIKKFEEEKDIIYFCL